LQKLTCGELPVPIDKSKHKFVRGPRGANIENLFQTTGVHIELPPQDSDSNVVILRGETQQLANALARVYEIVWEYFKKSVELILMVDNNI
jgi:hypothetical protein